MRAIEQLVVTAEQMRSIESRLFEAGMPVAALMEKVALRVAQQIRATYPLQRYPRVGVLVGPGHNGGDALVVARELHWWGYQVLVWCPFETLKELPQCHATYLKSLGIPFVQEIMQVNPPDFWIDGLFGFGLERPVEGKAARGIEWVNASDRPIVSIDLPSGLHTDTGVVLSTAIRATHTFCLGLWKIGLLQDSALDHVGEVELVEFDIPWADIDAILGEVPGIQRLTAATALRHLPIPNSPATHKYRRGHVVIIAGSARYRGAATLVGLGARASGVGMVTMVVPERLVPVLSSQLPEALVVACPENGFGAIDDLTDDINLDSYDAIICGPGLSLDAENVMKPILRAKRPVVMDADALNLLARQGCVPTLRSRPAFTVITPHPGEFERMFPDVVETGSPAYSLARKAAEISGATVVLKGARTVISRPQGPTWITPESSPSLARAGSGDVLAGLMGGLMAIAAAQQQDPESVVKTAVWWHAQAGRWAARERTDMGVDAYTLCQSLIPTLGQMQQRGSAR